MTASDDRRESWVPPARADWVEALNAEGRGMDIRGMVPLDAESLITAATRSTGLADFGEPGWEEPFRVLVRALDEEAELNLTGRLMCRAEMLVFLQNRLQIEDCYRRHPEIDEEQIRAAVALSKAAAWATPSAAVTGSPRRHRKGRSKQLDANIGWPAASLLHFLWGGSPHGGAEYTG